MPGRAALKQKWNEHLAPYLVANRPLFDNAFTQIWASETWSPTEEDRRAASALHTQIISRITVQHLSYREGVEIAALASIYQLFERTREITDAHFGCRHFEALAWEFLNLYVRPFTAKWHRIAEQGGLEAQDASDEFRTELSALQPKLATFDELLVDIRDGVRLSVSRPENRSRSAILTEMGSSMAWGISEHRGVSPETAKCIDNAERAAIKIRRSHYDVEDTKHAVGLALSGGGIRSTTFALGVLIALSKRNILPQIDYFSTVSGGGYLGSFLLTFLASPKSGTYQAENPGANCKVQVEEYPDEPNIGLRADQLPFKSKDGEAEALRYIRHNSRYLSAGSMWNRLEIAFAQLYGLLINFLIVTLIAVVLALTEYPIRQLVHETTLWPAAFFILVGTTVLVPLLLFRWPPFRTNIDFFLATLGILAIGLLSWQLIGILHGLFDFNLVQLGTVSKTGLVLALSTIAITSACITLLSQRFHRLKLALVAAAALTVPLLFLGIELATYDWLAGQPVTISSFSISLPREIALLIIFALLFALIWCQVDVNFTSPHRHYRNKLSAAFLIQPSTSPTPERPFDVSVRLLLSEALKQGRSPYPLINCALNVPSSKSSAMQGRYTDFFLFSPRFCGSPLIGYKRTEDWEAADSNLNVGTAMAISGAAAAPQMGLGTMRHLSFWLALLNVRLGYWVKKPDDVVKSSGSDRPGPRYLLREMFGILDERSRFVNVTDGGHIENLGVYELLRRRCKFIIAVDGEHDPAMTFYSLTNLQRMAAIDLGVTIDIDLEDLRLDKLGLSRSHFRFCRILYRATAEETNPQIGYLLYIKLSLTGNEGEFIRRYRLDEPEFPHHSTANQFFTEAQFEAYRSLGEHVGEKIFLRPIVGALADQSEIKISDLFKEIGASMLEPLELS
jgi:hypothetical protein